MSDEHGPYPAVALDGDGKPVDSVTSGFGHLLGTGLLNAEESALLAARIAAPDLDAGHGLRTLSSKAVGFNPYGYHVGSIWPHDTAIAVHGLIRAGEERPEQLHRDASRGPQPHGYAAGLDKVISLGRVGGGISATPVPAFRQSSGD